MNLESFFLFLMILCRVFLADAVAANSRSVFHRTNSGLSYKFIKNFETSANLSMAFVLTVVLLDIVLLDRL